MSELHDERVTARQLQSGFSQTIIYPMHYSRAAREMAADILAEHFPEVLARALWKRTQELRKEVEDHRRIVNRRRAPLIAMPPLAPSAAPKSRTKKEAANG